MSTSEGEDAWLASAFTAFEQGARVVLGLGHDVAAVQLDSSVAVVTNDVLIDGVHFDLTQHAPADVAWKALGVNLSDLAAAASEPVGFVVGAVLPAPVSRELFDALMAGFAEASARAGCPCLGGDTNVASGPLTLSVTALGRPGPMGVLSRAGAQVGDRLSVTGPLGGSLAGRHLHVRPRNAAALTLARHEIPHAMMDLSDGLARDLPRLCQRSGVGARIDAAAIPVHADVTATAEPDRLRAALGDGEDFELLVAHAALSEATRETLEHEGVSLHEIGEVVGAAEGLRLIEAGEPRSWPEGGFDHVGSA